MLRIPWTGTSRVQCIGLQRRLARVLRDDPTGHYPYEMTSSSSPSLVVSQEEPFEDFMLKDGVLL
jgi:hypothetical protein